MKTTTGKVGSHAVYVMLGVDIEGKKEVLGFHISPSESKSTWMSIFDILKAHGVKYILFLSMEGLSGLEALVLKQFSLILLYNVALST